MTNILIACGILIVAALVARWNPMLGGIIAMLPTKAIGYTIILSGGLSAQTLQKGVEGMLIGTLCITVPVLVLLWLWAR